MSFRLIIFLFDLKLQLYHLYILYSSLGFDAYKVLDYNLTEAYIDFEEAKISNLKVYDYTLRHCLLRNMVNLYIKKN